MSQFTDISGKEWHISIVTKSVDLVKRYCKDKKGNPVDLFHLIENNQIEQILYDIELLCNIVFVLCRDQIFEIFDCDNYDIHNESTYADFPELKDESKVTKASRWFGSYINGAVLSGMITAFQEALIEFFPSENQKAILKKTLLKIQELEKLHSEMIQTQLDKSVEQIKPKMEQAIESQFNRGISGE
jgi:hypothetical protein